MKKIDINEAVNTLGEYARELEQGPLVLTDGGHAIAALVPIEDADLESLSLSLNPKFQSLIQTARDQHLAGSSLSAEEVRRELESR